jgi:hypothetical protein
MGSMFPSAPVQGYQSSSTILGIAQSPQGRPILNFEAHSSSGSVLYLVSLFELNHNETNLSDGRFKNYRATQRNNEVLVSLDLEEKNNKDRPYSGFLKDQIEWVAVETHNTPVSWAFSIEALHISVFEHHFFFSDNDLAIHFKLYWS